MHGCQGVEVQSTWVAKHGLSAPKRPDSTPTRPFNQIPMKLRSSRRTLPAGTRSRLIERVMPRICHAKEAA
jgi:hypothetical protein